VLVLIVPFLLIVFSVRQYLADVDSLRAIINFANEPVPIAFYVKDRPLFHGISAGESLAHICQILPLRFFGDTKPCVQCRLHFRVSQRRFFQFLAADHVHGRLAVRIMRI
jgi:hypothetical protein